MAKLKTMRIFIASDHAGFELKQTLTPFLKGLGYDVEDCGAYKLNPADDYPEFIKPLARKISQEAQMNADENADKRGLLNVAGIIIGGSGQGEDMVADKFPHVRSAEYYGGNLEIVKLAREHNDANVLSLGARFLSEEEAKNAVKLFLETPFSEEERHKRRISQIG